MNKSLSDKAALLIALNVVKYAIGFLIPIFLVRWLSKDEYGTYQQLLLIGSAMVGVMHLGLPQSIYYFYNTVEAPRQRTLVLQTVSLLALSGLTAALLVYVFRDDFAGYMSNDRLGELLPLYCLYLVFFIASEYLIDLLISQDRYTKAVVIQGLETVARALILIVPLALGGGLQGLVISIAVYALLRFVVYSYFAKGAIWPLPPRYRRHLFYSEQLKYSLPLAASSMVGLVGRLLDRAIISVNFTPSQFATYAVGALELPLDVIFQSSVANVLRASLPPLVKQRKLKEVVGIWRESVRKLALIILPVFVFVAVFSYEFITLLFTDSYADSVHVFRIYLLLMPLHIFVLSLIPQVFGLTKISFQITLATVSVNVVLSLLLVSLVGYYGPAIATVTSTYVGVSIYFLVAMRLLNATVMELVPFAAIARVLMIAIVAAVVASLAGRAMDNAFVQFMSYGVCYGIVYIALALIFGVLTQQDKALLRQWGRRLAFKKS